MRHTDHPDPRRLVRRVKEFAGLVVVLPLVAALKLIHLPREAAWRSKKWWNRPPVLADQTPSSA